MLFNTASYAYFFAFVFAASWALSKLGASRVRVGFLLIASYGFYAAWDVRYLPLIFGSSTVDFFLAKAIAREARPKQRKRWLLVTVALNLGFLAVFKYADFAVENVDAVVSLLSGEAITPHEALRLLPPVGISFFTFESMSYVIDVYRGDIEPHDSYFRYLLFVSFFPHLVAGPIVRPRDLLPQLEREPELKRAEAGEAMFLIATGLLKKVAIGDFLAVNLVERVFERPTSFSSLEILAAIYGYAVQIYCDFSGYTDIAIGSALLLGVRFPKNFDAPYKAADLADFWRRWHISLSTWLRDYLYIPLGGNRGSSLLTTRNLLLTMLLGGLWHGASWTFVFWGFLHGAGLAVTRVVQRRRAKHLSSNELGERGATYRTSAASAAPRAARGPHGALRALLVFATFHYVCLAWVFFRAKTFGGALAMLGKLGEGTTHHENLPLVVVLVLALGLLSHYVPERVYERTRVRFAELPAPLQGALLFAVALVLHEFASTAAVPFVYFQF